jgi:hypothetical protein
MVGFSCSGGLYPVYSHNTTAFEFRIFWSSIAELRANWFPRGFSPSQDFISVPLPVDALGAQVMSNRPPTRIARQP